MSMQLRLLIVEDSEDDTLLLLRELRKAGYVVTYQRVDNPEAMRIALGQQWDLIISDYVLPLFSAPDALRMVRESGIDLPFIIVSGIVGEDVAVESMKAGAHDYISKVNLKRLVPAIEREMREAAVRRERRSTEKALEFERRRFDEVLETLPVLVALLTPDYHVSFANRIFRDRFGDSLGRRCFEYCFGSRSARCEFCETHNVLKSNTPHHWEYACPDGRHYEIHDYPFIDADGAPLILKTGIDVTERKRAEEELRLHRDHLEELVKQRTEELALLNQLVYGSLESSDVGAWWIDFKEEDTYHALDNSSKMLGITPAKDKSYRLSKWGQLLIDTKTALPEYADMIDRTFELLSGAISNKYEKYRATYPVLMAAGSVKWFDARADVPLRDEQGKALLMTGTIIDITERKCAEEALKQSEERFRFLVQQVKDYAIFSVSAEGCVASWNLGAERIYGYRAEEIIGQHVSVFHAKDAIDLWKPWLIIEIAAAEGQFKEEGWRIRKNGSQFWADVVITALRDEAGNLQGFSTVTRDIDERRKAQEALNYRLALEKLVVSISNRFINIGSDEMESETIRALEEVRTFVDADRCDLYLFAPDKKTIAQAYGSCSAEIEPLAQKYVGCSLESVFPWLFEKLSQLEPFTIHGSADLPPEAEMRNDAVLAFFPLSSGNSLIGYLILGREPGGKRWTTEDLDLVRLVGETLRNTLERIRSEAERRRLEEEVLEAQRKEMEARLREHERMAALGQMASGIAHDIRNPMNFVSLALDHLSDPKLRGKEKELEIRDLFADAHSELLRVNKMIQGLLDYGRPQTSRLAVENASEILVESRDEIIRQHPDREPHISLEGNDGVFPILADRDYLFRALVNLLENALEAGGPGGLVRAGLGYHTKNKSDILLWVEDSGPGIAEEDLGKIFTPYFTKKKGGLGLGLTLTQKWVNEMGGKIQVYNAPPGGARFELTFPVAGTDKRVRAKRRTDTSWPPAASPSLIPKRPNRDVKLKPA